MPEPVLRDDWRCWAGTDRCPGLRYSMTKSRPDYQALCVTALAQLELEMNIEGARNTLRKARDTGWYCRSCGKDGPSPETKP